MPRADNTPQGKLKNIPAEKVKTIVGDLITLHSLGKCESDEAVERRIGEYFQLCRETSIRPGIESLACALHVDRTTIFKWGKGVNCSPRRTDAINAARAMIGSFLEQAQLQGQVNPVSAIFLCKNWLGYTDSLQVEVSRPDPLANLTPEQIAERIRQDIPIDAEPEVLIEDHGTEQED